MVIAARGCSAHVIVNTAHSVVFIRLEVVAIEIRGHWVLLILWIHVQIHAASVYYQGLLLE